MSPPAERRGRFCSVAPPATDGVGTAAFICCILISPSLTSLTVPRCPSIMAISRIVLATNLTLATAPRAEQSVLLSGGGGSVRG